MYECITCLKPASLKCGKCKAVSYCSRKCQETHFNNGHKIACKEIAKTKKNLDNEENTLRNWKKDPYDPFGFGDSMPFDAENIGRFYGLFETRPFMRAKFAYFDKLRKLEANLSFSLAESQAFEMMTLCRSDNLAIREYIPSVLLSQNGKEQQCYDFIKWYLVGTDDNYDWGDISLPFLNVEDANMLEIITQKDLSKFHSLAFIIALMILKLRLYHNFLEFKKNFYHFLHGTIDEKNPLSRFSGNHLVLREIYQFSCYIPLHAKINEPCCKNALKLLKYQIYDMYEFGVKNNKIVWKGLMNPRPLLSRPLPSRYGFGSEEEAHLKVDQYIFPFNKMIKDIGDSAKVFTDLVGDLNYEY